MSARLRCGRELIRVSFFYSEVPRLMLMKTAGWSVNFLNEQREMVFLHLLLTINFYSITLMAWGGAAYETGREIE
ncbi:hypothetical protein SDC9_129267 [bioreactor metagenome]|uniref:Uncharacterized protein n=1 Tax=bioreactor metagenome TaxID=1076179 RepID=A0A645CYF8_9ZZZZ